MRSRALLVVGLLAAGAAAPAAASAAQVQVNRACFADPLDRADTVQLSGSGFTPDATYQVTLDGQPLAGGSGRVDASGAVSGSFVAPGVTSASRLARQHTYRIGVEEGANAPETTFTVSRLYASFRPATGTLSTLKVRFSVYGFGLQGDAAAPVYLHYVRPDGKLERTPSRAPAASCAPRAAASSPSPPAAAPGACSSTRRRHTCAAARARRSSTRPRA